MYEYPSFEGKPLVPTKGCQREMDEITLSLWQVKEVLEQGYDCSRSRRAQNVVERGLYRKGKEIRVVAALVEWREGSFWRIIHVGKTS